VDENGRVVVEVAGLLLKRAGREALAGAAGEHIEDWLYEIEWQPDLRRPAVAVPGADLPGAWLILADGTGLGRAFAELVLEHGDRCTVVRPGAAYRIEAAGKLQIDPAHVEDFQHLIADLPALAGLPCRGVIHLWGLELPAPQLPEIWPPEAQAIGCPS